MINQTDRLNRYCLLILTTIAVSTALVHTRSIMIPFILSVFIAFILLPVKMFLEQKAKLPRSLSLTVILLSMILSGGFFSLIVSSAVRQLANNADLYQARFIEISEILLIWIKDLGVSIQNDKNPIENLITQLPLFSFARTLTEAAVKVISDIFLVVIFVVFLLAGPTYRLPNHGIWPEIDRLVRSYLITKFIASTLTGSLTAVILMFFDLDMAMMFGFLAFILNFIPNVGSILATLLPVPVAILQFSDPLTIILIVGLPGLVQFFIGNVIEPKFMGDSLDLHPVTILFGLMFWGLIWGPIGMILATPITVIIKVALERTSVGKGLAKLMAGRLSSET